MCSISVVSHSAGIACASLHCSIKAPAQKLFLTGIWQDPVMFSDSQECSWQKRAVRSGRMEVRGEEYLAVYNRDCVWSQVTLHFCPEATHVLLVLNPLKTCISKHLSFKNTLWNTIFSCWAFYLFTPDRQKRVKIVLGSLGFVWGHRVSLSVLPSTKWSLLCGCVFYLLLLRGLILACCTASGLQDKKSSLLFVFVLNTQTKNLSCLLKHHFITPVFGQGLSLKLCFTWFNSC